jgi:hypothetical protein
MSLNSPLSGSVKSRFGGSGRSRSKFAAAIAVVVSIPFFVSTFAASVTVGSGALTFGQGSQQAVACDSQVYVALAQEWKSAPTPQDSTAGFFRVKSVTVSGLDLVACQKTKLRVRLINMQGQEIVLGPSNATVLQMAVPTSAAPDMSTSGTSVYDGSTLSANSADVTFYLDPTMQTINIDGAVVGRTTVESVNNPSAMG